jgi:NodT family efflux transporter outer membrane factor (OMF) lipoprotein
MFIGQEKRDRTYQRRIPTTTGRNGAIGGRRAGREDKHVMRSAIARIGWAPGLAVALLSGCAMVGPDFQTPDAAVNAGWAGSESRISAQPGEYAQWWRTFDDPALTQLIELGYRQNLPLRSAGIRVLQARAQLGVVIGQQYPQQQEAVGELARQRESSQVPFAPQGNSSLLEYTTASIGVQAAWELDLWGKFRRAVEAADAQLAATVAGYDDVLVSLTAELATAYIQLRTFEQQLLVANKNVGVQQEGLQIAAVRFRGGTTDERDVEQARTILASTQATIPQLEQQIEQTKNAIATLIGLPPSPLEDLLGSSGGIPLAPAQVGIGVPADLLRRRPDIRQAEAVAASQSALIGFQKADLYPSFTLLGTFGFEASDWQQFDLTDLFKGRSRAFSFGPAIVWDFLNYGRIENQVRAQDAAFEQALTDYQNTVLVAQREVENGLVGFRKQQERAQFLSEAVRAAQRSLDLAFVQYRSGVTDFTTVLVAEQQLLAQQDDLALTAGAIPANLVATYRALGGGWEIREDRAFVPPQTVEAMTQRTNWGQLLDYEVRVPPIPVPNPERPRLPEW